MARSQKPELFKWGTVLSWHNVIVKCHGPRREQKIFRKHSFYTIFIPTSTSCYKEIKNYVKFYLNYTVFDVCKFIRVAYEK